MKYHIPRRRCGWCMVPLRWWQRCHCRRCSKAIGHEAGIYLQSGGPPCKQGSRWTAEPDRLIGRSR